MKKFLQTIRNIWSIEELRSKIIVTLLLIFVYRFGSHVVLPGIDPNRLNLSSAKEGLLGLFDTFAGGSFSNASIFALGIMPLGTLSRRDLARRVAVVPQDTHVTFDFSAIEIVLMGRYAHLGMW